MKEFNSKYYTVLYSEDYVKLINKGHGVVILPITKDNKIILLNIYRCNTKAVEIELPRGFVELNNSFEETALKELKEELNCTPTHLINLGDTHPDTGLMNSNVKVYLAKIEDCSSLKPQTSEGIKGYRLYDMNTVLNLINNNCIKDGFTLSAILKYISSSYIVEEFPNE